MTKVKVNVWEFGLAIRGGAAHISTFKSVSAVSDKYLGLDIAYLV
jgi:hypothetical protein